MATEPADAQTLESPIDGCRRLNPPLGHYYVGDKLYPSPATAEGFVRGLILLVGEDPDRPGLKETPGRVVRALIEMTQGYRDDPADIFKTFDEKHDEMVVLKGCPFTSMCEHHLLVFEGTADIGYLPGKVVGLSKLARLVDCFSRRLQMQERMTRQIAEAIRENLEAPGVAVVVRARHSCLACRGVRKHGTEMVTSAMLGVFRDSPGARAEFLALCNG